MLRNKAIRIILHILAAILLLMAGFYVYFKIVTRVDEPEIAGMEGISMTRVSEGPDVWHCEHGWLRKAREGWWLMYLEGSPYEVGYAHGLLTQELSYAQEKAFLERLQELIPTKIYQDFMLSFARFFNRNLEDYVKEEYKEEIYGISRFASPEFNFMGPAYARMLNYHAAHDLGHAVQNMNLVACTAFGAWGSHSADSSLIIGRNFDFFVNDDFAKDKILCFIKPDSGYSFSMITWAGFAGVVSGMNEKGLTITLNAAKSSIPTGAKTPVSLLAREILQYASNIEEAYRIAKSRETFVAESFLIGSAANGKAVVIEKSPELTDIYDPDTNYIAVTNHFQSPTFRNDQLNLENMQNETSVYRLERVVELLHDHPSVGPEVAAAILRNYKGLEGKDIGLGNEKAVNQFIAHHSVIFQPAKRRIWVAGPPYQLEEYVAYDLDSVFTAKTQRREEDFYEQLSLSALAPSRLNNNGPERIPSDTAIISETYQNLLKYRHLAAKIESGEYSEGDADSLIKYNPEYFHTYRILGDYCGAKGIELRAKGKGLGAEDFYRFAVEKEAPSAVERSAIGR
jgi:isopenicillin-N N-acyltransferase-like protein